MPVNPAVVATLEGGSPGGQAGLGEGIDRCGPEPVRGAPQTGRIAIEVKSNPVAQANQ